METSIKITLIVVAAVLVLAVFVGYGVMQITGAKETVTGNGQAAIKAMPDLVTVYFSVQTNGSTTTEASDKNSEIVDDLTTELIKLGFEKKDIVTESISVQPDYSWEDGTNKLIGYRAYHSIKVEMPSSDTRKIGDTVEAGTSVGALIDYINFELS